MDRSLWKRRCHHTGGLLLYFGQITQNIFDKNIFTSSLLLTQSPRSPTTGQWLRLTVSTAAAPPRSSLPRTPRWCWGSTTSPSPRTLSGERGAGGGGSRLACRKVLKVSEVINHPSYNPSTSENDIALLKLAESVDLNTYSPACLPAQGADFTGQKGWVYGQSSACHTSPQHATLVLSMPH